MKSNAITLLYLIQGLALMSRAACPLAATVAAVPQQDFVVDFGAGGAAYGAINVTPFTLTGCSEALTYTIEEKSKAGGSWTTLTTGTSYSFPEPGVDDKDKWDAGGTTHQYDYRVTGCVDFTDGLGSTTSSGAGCAQMVSNCFQLDVPPFSSSWCCSCGGGLSASATFTGSWCQWTSAGNILHPLLILDEALYPPFLFLPHDLNTVRTWDLFDIKALGHSGACEPTYGIYEQYQASDPRFTFPGGTEDIRLDVGPNDGTDTDALGVPLNPLLPEYKFTYQVYRQGEIMTQQDITLTLGDCATMDFEDPATQPSVTGANNDVTNLFNNVQTRMYPQDGKYYWMKQGGTFFFTLQPSPTPQRFPDQCGAFTYSLTYTVASPLTPTTITTYQAGAYNDWAVAIDSDIGLTEADQSISVTFTVHNNFGSKETATGVIALMGCDKLTIVTNNGPAVKQFVMGTDSDGTVSWEHFTFSRSFCEIDTYEHFSCEGPFMDAAGDLADPANQLQAFGSPGPTGNSICDDAFDIDLDKDARTITEKFNANSFTNFYEGEYLIKIKGYNSVYHPAHPEPHNYAIIDMIWRLEADCNDPTTEISGPLTVWSDAIIPSTHEHGPDFTRTYQSAPAPGDPEYPMEVYYGVGTNAQYSLTAQNWNPATSQWEQRDFKTNYPYSCRPAYTFGYYNTAQGIYLHTFADFNIQHISLDVVDDSNVSLQFVHDPAVMGTSGNSNYQLHKDRMYQVKVEIAGYEGGPHMLTIEFINRILPDCGLVDANSHQTTQTITGYLPISGEQRSADALVATDSFDDQVCNQPGDITYLLYQTNYPGPGDFNPAVFSFDDATRTVGCNINDHTQVVAYDTDRVTELCNLSDPLPTPECQVDYQIVAHNHAMNGTVAILVDSYVKAMSECGALQSRYQDSWWEWQGYTDFHAGYAVRDAPLTVEMPRMIPVLLSVNPVWPLCGDIVYSFHDDPQNVNLVQSVIGAPGDNSVPLKIVIQTDDYLLACTATPIADEFIRPYTFEVRVSFPDWSNFPETSGNSILTVNGPNPVPDLNFYVRDFCLGPTWTRETLQLSEPLNLYKGVIEQANTDSDFGSLLVKKHVLQPETTFKIQNSYVMYNKTGDGIVPVEDEGCGNIHFFIDDYNNPSLASNKDLFDKQLVKFNEVVDGPVITVYANSNELANQTFTLFYEMKFSVYDGHTLHIPTVVKSITIDVLPCVVEEFEGELIVPDYVEFLVDQAEKKYEWEQYKQEPMCNYTISYTLTSTDKTTTPFGSLTEGVFEDGLATFDNVTRVMKFGTTSDQYIDKSYMFYFNTVLHVDPFAQPNGLSILRAPFEVKTVTQLYEPPVSLLPSIDGIQEYYQIEAEKESFIFLGTLTAPPGVQVVRLESWKVEQGQLKWLSLKQELHDSSVTKVEISSNPPVEEIGEKYNIKLVISDDDETEPRYVEYAMVFEIIEAVYNVAANEGDYEPDFEQEATVQGPDIYGEVVIHFKYDMIFPNTTISWTSKNEGANFLDIVYFPSEESATYFEEAEIDQAMDWKVIGISDNEITLRLNFTATLAVSTSPYDLDAYHVNIKRDKKTEFIVVEENRPIKWRDEPIRLNLMQQVSIEEKPWMKSISSGIQTAITSFVAANFFAAFFLSGMLQLLWGMVNALQMIVLTVLFSVMRPVNAEVVLTTVMQYVNLDLFDTENFINLVFDFPKTEPFNPIFEKAGFQTTTYIIELGVIFFVVIGFAFFVPARELLNIWLQKTSVNNRLVQFLRKKSDEIVYKVIILRFLCEGCIELGATAMITVIILFKRSVLEQDAQPDGPEVGRLLDESTWTNSEKISNTLAVVTLVVLLASPLYLYFQAAKYFKHKDDAKFEKEYGHLFEGLSRDTFPQLKYSFVFIVRRCLMVLVLTLLPTQRNIQINIQLVSTLFVMSYTTYVLPFNVMLQNYQETMNEIIVLLASYHLFVFTEWVYDLDQRYRMGWSLIAFVIVLLITNTTILLYVTIRDSYRNAKRKYYTRRNTKIRNQLKQRRFIIERNANDEDKQGMQAEYQTDANFDFHSNYTMQTLSQCGALEPSPVRSVHNFLIDPNDARQNYVRAKIEQERFGAEQAIAGGQQIYDPNDWLPAGLRVDGIKPAELVPKDSQNQNRRHELNGNGTIVESLDEIEEWDKKTGDIPRPNFVSQKQKKPTAYWQQDLHHFSQSLDASEESAKTEKEVPLRAVPAWSQFSKYSAMKSEKQLLPPKQLAISQNAKVEKKTKNPKPDKRIRRQQEDEFVTYSQWQESQDNNSSVQGFREDTSTPFGGRDLDFPRSNQLPVHFELGRLIQNSLTGQPQQMQVNNRNSQSRPSRHIFQ